MLSGGVSMLGGGLGGGIPVLSVVPGIGGALGGLMGLFGGPSQSQKQEQSQNQNQNQSQQATANASSSSSAYNNLTINYPNQSAGMALEGLLGGAGAPFNPIGAPGVTQEGAQFAPQQGYQAPGLVNVQAVPAYAPSGSTFIGATPGGGGGAAPAMAAPNMPPPSQPQAFAAGPNGGSFSPQAATGALQAAQQFAPSGSTMVGQAPQVIANAPANPGAAFGYAPNPYAPPRVVSDATNATAMPAAAPQRSMGGSPAGGGVDAPPDTQSLLPPELPGLKATELPSPFATARPRKNETPEQANQPATKDGAELYQIPSKLPDDLKMKLRAEYNELKDLPQQLQSQIIPGTGLTRAQYQAELVGQIQQADESLKEISDISRIHTKLQAQAVERQLRRDAAGLADGAMAPDSDARGLVDRAAAMSDEMNNLSMSNARSTLAGRSLQYSGSPTHGQDILENRKFFYKVGNVLNPGRRMAAQNYVNNMHAAFITQAEKNIPHIMQREKNIDDAHENARKALMENLKLQVQVAKQQQLTASKLLNRDRILEANLLQMRRQDIMKNIKNTIDQSSALDRQGDLQAYRTLTYKLHELEYKHRVENDQRNAEDRETQIGINYAEQQLREQMAPAIYQRDMMMGQGMMGGAVGAPPAKTFFDEPLQIQQQQRKEALQGTIRQNPHMQGLVPPPPPIEPAPGTLGPGVAQGVAPQALSPMPGSTWQEYAKQLQSMGVPKNVMLDLINGAKARHEVR